MSHDDLTFTAQIYNESLRRQRRAMIREAEARRDQALTELREARERTSPEPIRQMLLDSAREEDH
jgi:hypothetical protein